MYPTVNRELSIFQADGIYDNPLELLDIKPEFSDDEGLNDSKAEAKVKVERKTRGSGNSVKLSGPKTAVCEK